MLQRWNKARVLDENEHGHAHSDLYTPNIKTWPLKDTRPNAQESAST